VTDLDLRRTAIHEAGHLTMCHALGVTTGMASIRPSDSTETFGWAGHGTFGFPKNPDPSQLDVPYPLMSTRLRRPIEKEICVCLAGDAAVRLYAPMRDAGFAEHEPCLATADELATKLTQRETKQLLAFESAEPKDGDLDTARHRSILAVGEHLTARYLLMMEAFAEQILCWDRPRRQIYALADAFGADPVLSARTIRQLLDEN